MQAHDITRRQQQRALRATPSAVEVDAERLLIARELRGRFQVIRPLGRGGMGAVYLARDLVLQRVVALKVLHAALMEDEGARERFRREARIAARLEHPGVASLHSFGEAGWLLYMVMRYVDGESLAERLRRVGRLDAVEVRRLLAELAATIAYAHAQGVVHRDLKPENILIERESGRPVLTDFGVSTLPYSESEQVAAPRTGGTPHFMAPEQLAGDADTGGCADVYALGVLGYLMLAGALPFTGRTVQEIVAGHLAGTPLPLARLAPDAPADLVATIERCLSKDPLDRWPSADALREALLHAAEPRSLWQRFVACFRASMRDPRRRPRRKPAERLSLVY
jgi:serine/threonine-protein kinase